MNMWIRIVPLCSLSLGSAASACSPDPNFGYDDILSQEVLLATATVKTFEIETSETSLCWNANYSDAQYLYGVGAKQFSIKTCWDKEWEDAELGADSEAFKVHGFVTNADVLVGLVRLSENPSELRYAIPSCWGWLHVNLDELSIEERDEFLQEIEDQIKNAE